jgi:probable O-glycosylation ligase (exosortase A-associated)
MFIFKRPYIGVCLWAWTALLFPNYLLWGFASNIRFNLIVSIITIFVVFFSAFKAKNLNNGVFYWVLLLLIWASLSTTFALAVPELVFDKYIDFVKVIFLFTMILLTITKKIHVNALVLSIILGIGYYSVTEGLKVVATLGGHRAWGPGSSIIGDNNHFALAILVIIPFAIFAYRNILVNRYLKWAALGFTFISLMAILGTYSRGGLIGLAFLSFLYATVYKKKAFVSTLFLVVSLSYAAFVPQQWLERMDTIKSADQDNSFMGRVIAWKQSTLVALDRPFIGGGFLAIQNLATWTLYAQDFDKLSFVHTKQPDRHYAHAAHSIYFQVLGEHGFVGLFIYLMIMLKSYSNIISTNKILKKNKVDEGWYQEFSDCLLLSLSLYLVVGAALNMAYFDILFVIIALTQVLYRLVKKTESATNES